LKRPHITLKFAETLDGRISAKDGSSRWISSPESRVFAHKLRARNDAVLVGIGTVLRDNPALTTRLVKGKNPARVIIDRKLKTPLDSKVVKSASSIKTFVITTSKSPKKKATKLRALGVQLIVVPSGKSGEIDLKKVIRILYQKGLKNVLVEGGSGIITSFLKSGLADKVIAIIAPKILGEGTHPVGGLGIGNIKRALKLKIKKVKRLGGDIVCTAFLRGTNGRN